VTSRLPITATPSVPPICRNAPLVADPTPVCSCGSDPITDAVADGITRPAPTPSMITPASVPVYVVVTVAPEIRTASTGGPWWGPPVVSRDLVWTVRPPGFRR
jgi:hypothetical protein